MSVHEALCRTHTHYYFIGEADDVLFELGRCAYACQWLTLARSFVHESLDIMGAHGATFFNLALCLQALDELPAALEMVERALVWRRLECEKGMMADQDYSPSEQNMLELKVRLQSLCNNNTHAYEVYLLALSDQFILV